MREWRRQQKERHQAMQRELDQLRGLATHARED
jgi:hypothetical protein